MSMSSLVPGMLFKNTGLNQSHTPTVITSKPDEVKTKYRRSSIPTNKWPPESPVAKIYDINNSSSCLILLNNKMEKKSHLRVQSGRYKRTDDGQNLQVQQPDRHFKATSPQNSSRHEKCHDSSTPCFTASQPVTNRYDSHLVRASRQRASASARPYRPSEWHHYSSQVDSVRVASAPAHPKHQSKPMAKDLEPPPSFKHDKGWLLHPDMTRGQKLYVNSIAKVYDMTNMKQLKQAQYVQLIQRETQRDFFTPENFHKYLLYLHSERIRLFGVTGVKSVLVKNKQSSKWNSPVTSRSQTSQHFSTKQSPKQSNQVTPINPDNTLSTDKQTAPRPLYIQQKEGNKSASSCESDHIATPEKEKSQSNSSMQVKVDGSKKKSTLKTEKGQQSTTPPTSMKYRPKSSKYSSRKRAEDKNTENSAGNSKPVEEKRGKTNGCNNKDQFWQQPPPPEEEIEPNGDGLTMTSDKSMDREGEALQDITTNSTSTNNAANQTHKSRKQQAQQQKLSNDAVSTFDLEDKEGNKTRVYKTDDFLSKSQQARTKGVVIDDTPIIKEYDTENATAVDSTPKGNEELPAVVARKQAALESDRESKDVNCSDES